MKGARLFLGGQAVSLLGDGLALLTLPLLVLRASDDPLLSGLTGAAGTIAYLAVGLPAGVIVDRLPAVWILAAADTTRCLLYLALFTIATTRSPPVATVLAIALAAGIAQVFFDNAVVVVIKDGFAAESLPTANAVLELATQGSLIVGPACVAGLIALGSLDLALLVNALTFAVSLATLAWVPRSRAEPRARQTFRASFLEGLRYLLSVRVLVLMTLVQLVANLSLGVEKLIIYEARVTLHLSATATALTVALGGLGGVLGAATTAALVRRLGAIRVTIFSLALCGPAVGAIGLASSAPVLALANCGYAWFITTASLANRVNRQTLVPRALLGRVTATVRLLVIPVDPIGVLLASALTEAADSPRPAFYASGALVTATALAGWLAGLRKH